MVRKFLSCIFIFFCTFNSLASNVSSLPTREIGGVKFYLYTVNKDETIFKICNKLDITADVIYKYNPQLPVDLKKGDKIFFPFEESTATKNSRVLHILEQDFQHTIKDRENVEIISKIYGIKAEDIITKNNLNNDKIAIGDILNLPQPQKLYDNTKYYYYTLKPTDTLTDLAERFCTSISMILEDNPRFNPLISNQNNVLRIKFNQTNLECKHDISSKFLTYKAKSKDTYNSIAKLYNIPVDNITDANLDIKHLKKNIIVSIPIVKQIKPSLNSQQQRTYEKQIFDSLYNNTKTTNIAFVLPFNLHSTVDKQSELYTEFYEGFLLALNEFNNDCKSKDINIYVFDTESSKSKTREILNSSKLKSMNYIFVSDSNEGLQLFSEFGIENNINIINPFIIKDDNYIVNKNLIQINLPFSYLSENIFKKIDTKFKNYDVIFISEKGTKEKDIIDPLRRHLESNNITIHKIDIDGDLNAEELDLSLASYSNYLIVPTNSTLSLLKKIIPAINKIKEDRLDLNLSLFGFPEWMNYTNEFRSLENINTLIYSRFNNTYKSSSYKLFSNQFYKWYRKHMSKTAPKFGLLGYDLGGYLLSTICSHKDYDNYYTGLQNDFDFISLSNWSGLVNKANFFIELNNSGINITTK